MATTNTAAHLQAGLWQVGQSSIYFVPPEGSGSVLNQAIQKANRVFFAHIEGAPIGERTSLRECAEGKAIKTMSPEKVAEALSTAQTLVVANIGRFEQLMRVLSAQNVEIKGPKSGFFWEVALGDEIVAHLLGTVHKIPLPVLGRLNPKILEAFDSSKSVAVEFDVVSEKLVGPFATDGEKKIIDTVETGRQIVLMEGFLIERAKRNGQAVQSLESKETHQRAVDGEAGEKPEVIEEEYYDQFAEFIGEGLDQAALFFEMGSTEALEQNFDASDDKEETIARNIEMAANLDQLIKSGQKPFASLGAIHFAGAQGVGELMKQKGYTVTQRFSKEFKSS